MQQEHWIVFDPISIFSARFNLLPYNEVYVSEDIRTERI